MYICALVCVKWFVGGGQRTGDEFLRTGFFFFFSMIPKSKNQMLSCLVKTKGKKYLYLKNSAVSSRVNHGSIVEACIVSFRRILGHRTGQLNSH